MTDDTVEINLVNSANDGELFCTLNFTQKEYDDIVQAALELFLDNIQSTAMYDDIIQAALELYFDHILRTAIEEYESNNPADETQP